jgi:hypothetical protein
MTVDELCECRNARQSSFFTTSGEKMFVLQGFEVSRAISFIQIILSRNCLTLHGELSRPRAPSFRKIELVTVIILDTDAPT